MDVFRAQQMHGWHLIPQQQRSGQVAPESQRASGRAARLRRAEASIAGIAGIASIGWWACFKSVSWALSCRRQQRWGHAERFRPTRYSQIWAPALHYRCLILVLTGLLPVLLQIPTLLILKLFYISFSLLLLLINDVFINNYELKTEILSIYAQKIKIIVLNYGNYLMFLMLFDII